MRTLLVSLFVILFSMFNANAEEIDHKTPQPLLTHISTVVDDTSSGNSNGILEPGETARLEISIYNAGTATAFGVCGTLYTDEIGVSLEDRTACFGDIMPGTSNVSFSPHFTVAVQDSVPCGKNLQFQLNLIHLNGSAVVSFSHSMRTGKERDLAVYDQDMVLFGALAGDMAGYDVAHGDINGDGIEDMIVGVYNADGPGDAISDTGEVWVIYGATGPVSTIDLISPPVSATMIYGIDVTDHLGSSVASGDINGDGFDDLVMAADSGDGDANLRNACGDIWVVHGSSSLEGTSISLASPPSGSRVIYGADSSDYMGRSLKVDDINNDGFDDVIVGSYNSGGLGNSRNDAGEVWIIPGPITSLEIDLASPPANAIVIYGADVADYASETMATGDINGDGYADIILGTRLGDGPLNMSTGNGEVWVVYGDETLSALIDLASPPTNTTVFYGADSTDNLGKCVAAGDINNDGYDDIIAGAWWADGPGNNRYNAGDVWVFYGAAVMPASINLITYPENATVIFGPEDNDMLGSQAASGDLNGDGYDDLILSAKYGDGNGNAFSNAGDVWIIYGESTPPPAIDLASPPSTAVVVYGGSEDDYSAYSMDVADINDDGFEDALLGIFYADGEGELRGLSGEVSVILGRASSHYYLTADTYSWIDAASIGQDSGLDCDSCCVEVDLGFPFEFYGESYSSVSICDDGYITFSPVTISHAFNFFCFPSKYSPDNLIGAYWNDFSLENGGTVYTLAEGSEPNRRFTIEWFDVPHYSDTWTATFEITLFEGTNQVLVQYGPSGLSGLNSAAGLENMSGVNGQAFSCFEANLIDGTAWRAIPFGTYTLFYDDMENGANGWTSTGLWHQENTACSPNNRSPLTSWYFGDPATSCTYDTGLHETGLLNSPVISGDYYSFIYYWQRRDAEVSTTYDVSYIQVSENGGAFLNAVQSLNRDDAWGADKVDISAHSSNDISIGFFFDTIDDSYNDYLGWMIDNTEVWGCDIVGSKAMHAYAFARPTPVCETDTFLLDGTGTFVIGCESVTYQWYEDGNPIVGGTSLQYTIPSGHTPGLFSYTFEVTCVSPLQSELSEPVSVFVVEMPVEVPEDSFVLEKINGGADISMFWTDVSGAEHYIVYSDTDPAGTFENEAGTSLSGISGLMVSMPAENVVYYLVAGANDTCGVGPKR